MVLDNSVRIPRAPTYSGTASPLRHDFGYGDFTLSVAPSHALLLSCLCRLSGSPITPSLRWFGLLRFRSPLLTESLLLSSPAGTEMFQFPAFRLIMLCVHMMMSPPSWRRVPPFGHRRISACLLLPVAFRRSLRPSSPLCA